MFRRSPSVTAWHSLFVVSAFAVACNAACTRRVANAAPSAAPAPPQTPAPIDKSERPLVPNELKEPADVARALAEHYTKFEHHIPMRDGVKLFTTVYVPKDRTRKYPILLERTPYGVAPYGIDNLPTDKPEKNAKALSKIAPSPLFVREGYVFAHQDVRGRMMSEGTFVDVRPHRTGNSKLDIDESTDAWDTIDWLVKNVPGNNGLVGTWGISYPGFYAAQAAIDAHPALKAVSPQAPVTEWFVGDDFHHNGAFFVADALGFYSAFGKPRPKPIAKATWEDLDIGDIYDFYLRLGPLSNANARHLEGKIPFWNDLMLHGTRDAFWQARDPRPHYRDATPAVMTVGGLYDAEDLFGALETYRSFERQNPRAGNTLVLGPWSHGGWARSDGDKLGDIAFGAKTAVWYREAIEFPFFQRHLKGRKSAQPEAWVFETGTNQWNAHASWPPKGAQSATLYLRAGGKLASSAPPAREDETGADAYVSDPAKPVPYDASTSGRLEHDYVIRDQRFATRRPDVVSYSSGELDADVTLGGPLEADLWITTTGTDADFVVKLIDVFPDNAEDPVPNPRGVRMAGYQSLVRAEVMRGKFRNGFEKPEPFKPNEPARVRFALPDVSHTFRSGHRIMVQIQSSWFPLVDRNPQTFVDIYQAKESDFRIATHRILRTLDRPSSLKVALLRGSLPAPK